MHARLAAAGYAALAALDTTLAAKAGKSRAARRARYVVKPLLMPALSVAFTEATRGRGDTLTRATQAAQALSWGGDVALLGHGERSFLSGVGSFAGAHAAYIGGFATRRTHDDPLNRPGPKAAAGIWATAAPIMGVAAARRSRELGLPVAGYGTILAAMFAASSILDKDVPRSARTTIQVGTGLFLLSDSLLGVQKFLLREPSPALEAAVMATYTAGQGLIAAGVARS